MATAKKTTRKSTTKKDLEAKIADLEAKLNKLAAAQDAKPAETAPKPAEKAPPASGELHERFREIPTGNWNTQKVAITGFTAPSNRYFGSRALVAEVEVTPSNWNDQKTKVTGYTAPSNKYFATKQRLAYHPEAKNSVLGLMMLLHQKQRLKPLPQIQQKMSMLQEWQKKEPLYQKDSSKMLKQLVHTNH